MPTISQSNWKNSRYTKYYNLSHIKNVYMWIGIGLWCAKDIKVTHYYYCYIIFPIGKNVTYHKQQSLEAKWHSDNSECQVQSPESRVSQDREKKNGWRIKDAVQLPKMVSIPRSKVASAHRLSLPLVCNSFWFSGHCRWLYLLPSWGCYRRALTQRPRDMNSYTKGSSYAER